MKDSSIGWCHHTINFWMGCDKQSDECAGCYAEAFMIRRKKDFNVLRPTKSPWLEAELLNARAETNKVHELVFTCSLSDFFHIQADPWREEAWDVIRRSPNLIWLILTKRPERIANCLPKDWSEGKAYPNVWLGTTCGKISSESRVDILRKIPCALHFLSCEPLLDDICELNLNGIGWILCGGMSGALSEEKKYKMDIRWAASLFFAAKKANVPFLFKQVSDFRPEKGINALGLYCR